MKMSPLEEAIYRLAEARFNGDRLVVLDARLKLAKCYQSQGYHLQAQKHAEILSRENAYWQAEAFRVVKN